MQRLKDVDRLILYDATRLINEHAETTPTEISWVDLNYALFLRERFGTSVKFIAQVGHVLRLVPDDLAQVYFNHLNRVWTGKGIGEGFQERLQQAGLLRGAKKSKPPIRIRHQLAHRLRQRFFRLFALAQWIRSHVSTAIGLGERYGGPVAPEPERTVLEEPSGFAISSDLATLLRSSPRAGRFYFNIGHADLTNTPLYLTLKGLAFEIVTYIHDIIPIDFPEYAIPGEEARHTQGMKTVLTFSTNILCSSEYVSTRIKSVASEWNYHKPVVMVARMGVTEIELDPRFRGLDLNRPNFLAIGTIEGRKNHLMLLHLWREMVEQGMRPPLLILAGNRGCAKGSVLGMLDRCKAIQNHIIEIRNFPSPKLFALLTRARALLQPSFSESWGMPIIESLSLAVPVICSDIPVFHEASQECADFISPYDPKAWKQAILDYAEPDSLRRARFLEKLKSFEPPQWRDAFGILEAIVLESETARHAL